MSRMLIAAAMATALTAWTTYSGPQEGRAELAAGEAAPFAGVLLSETALADVREELAAARSEAASLRLALEQQRVATAAADARAEMWEREAKGSGWRRALGEAAKWWAVGCTGAAVGVWIGR